MIKTEKERDEIVGLVSLSLTRCELTAGDQLICRLCGSETFEYHSFLQVQQTLAVGL